MANDIQDTVRDLLISAIEGTGKTNGAKEKVSGAGRPGLGGLAAGMGAAALVPVAAKRLGKLARDMGIDGLQDVAKSPAKAVQGLTSDVGDHVGSQIGNKISEKVDESGGPAGILKDTVKDVLPFGGGGGGGTKGGGLGVGKGRRMPVQQSVDIGAPIEVVYNQWTQFEDWPNFMHRVVRVTQDDDCTVSMAVKIWGKTKEFTAEIETQRPNDRVRWRVSQGITHAGVVSFHELAPNLTRVLLAIDVQPGGLLEKAARGMRHVKRAVRGDLHRFKAFIEMAEVETGAWRGVIEDGEVVEEHDPSYDEQREYSDPEAFNEDADDSEDGDDSEDDENTSAETGDDGEDSESDEQPQAKRPRRQRKSSSNGHGADEEPSHRSTRSKASGSGRAATSRRSSASNASARKASSSGRSKSASGSRSSGGSSSSRRASSGSGSGSTRRASASTASGRRTRSRKTND